MVGKSCHLQTWQTSALSGEGGESLMLGLGLFSSSDSNPLEGKPLVPRDKTEATAAASTSRAAVIFRACEFTAEAVCSRKASISMIVGREWARKYLSEGRARSPLPQEGITAL